MILNQAFERARAASTEDAFDLFNRKFDRGGVIHISTSYCTYQSSKPLAVPLNQKDVAHNKRGTEWMEDEAAYPFHIFLLSYCGETFQEQGCTGTEPNFRYIFSTQKPSQITTR